MVRLPPDIVYTFVLLTWGHYGTHKWRRGYGPKAMRGSQCRAQPNKTQGCASPARGVLARACLAPDFYVGGHLPGFATTQRGSCSSSGLSGYWKPALESDALLAFNTQQSVNPLTKGRHHARWRLFSPGDILAVDLTHCALVFGQLCPDSAYGKVPHREPGAVFTEFK